MVGAALAFSLMGVAVKAASSRYGAGELVMYRSLIGVAFMAALMRARGIAMRTRIPGLHLTRSLSGTVSLCLWFVAIGALPLGTAVTLNYTSSIWIAVFVLGGHLALKRRRLSAQDSALALAVLVGFAGVALVLQPAGTLGQWLPAAAGVASGLLAGVAYLQVQQLGHAGEPGERVVFYFALCGVLAGAGMTLFAGSGFSAHDAAGVALLLAIGVLATLGQWAMTRAYAIGRALANASLQYLGIGFSFLLGVWLFGDPVTPAAIAGMVLIVGAGIAAGRLARAPANPE
jgi:drug/metabolite transporter (DMT)-like permease